MLVCSIDNMPTQLPMEATDFFGNLVYPYALDIIQSDASRPIGEHNFSPAVQSAIIASNGELMPKFKYIEDLRTLHVRSHHKTSGLDEETRKVKGLRCWDSENGLWHFFSSFIYFQYVRHYEVLHPTRLN